MHKFVNQAVGWVLAASATFAHAEVGPTTVQALTTTAPRTELSVQSALADGGSILVRSFLPGGGRQDAVSTKAPTGDPTSAEGMLFGALAIMGIVVRRRWKTRG
jgi:hypothetical protein